jgi:hypothetical protein
MMAQLDPGFTNEGFWANVAIQVLAAFVGTLGAFLVAWLVYRRQSKEERTQFEESLAHERELFQEQRAHDLEVRREEDRNRQLLREAEAGERERRMLLALQREIKHNLTAIGYMENTAFHAPLRTQAFERAYLSLQNFPEALGWQIQVTLYHVDRFNSTGRKMDDAKSTLEYAAQRLAEHMAAQGYVVENGSGDREGADGHAAEGEVAPNEPATTS